MNDRGMSSILSSKVKLGTDASVAGGPVGRDASADTDAWIPAEILSYSRSRGLFAGVSLESTTLRPDDDASEQPYGHAVTSSTFGKEFTAKRLESRLEKVTAFGGLPAIRYSGKRPVPSRNSVLLSEKF
jgi:lipid-binding SYLF domain-containing protein